MRAKFKVGDLVKVVKFHQQTAAEFDEIFENWDNPEWESPTYPAELAWGIGIIIEAYPSVPVTGHPELDEDDGYHYGLSSREKYDVVFDGVVKEFEVNRLEGVKSK